MRLVLASASPRRADLLRDAGFEFDIKPVDLDESPRPGEPAREYVARVAREKAEAVAITDAACCVVGADTAVVVDGAILGKPSDPSEAVAMLTRLSGRTHEVLTGVCALHAGVVHDATVTTRVRFRDLDPAEIRAYVATGEPMDKAGAYAVQGGAAAFVAGIEGSHSNVVGLPMEQTAGLLARCGVRPAGPGNR
jgi:nucleoside triphosphate pyrophosphatase